MFASIGSRPHAQRPARSPVNPLQNMGNAPTVPSAATVDLTSYANSLRINISGTTTIAGVAMRPGQIALVRFLAALVLTNGTAFVLPGGANITTQVNDCAFLWCNVSGTVFVLSYESASGYGLNQSVPVSLGGTGLSALTAHGVMLGEGAGNVNFATVGTSGRVLLDQGAGSDPAFVSGPSVVGNWTFEGQVFLTNNEALSFTDTAGTHPFINCQSDNDIVFYTTSNTGSLIPVFNTPSRTAVPYIGVAVPLEMSNGTSNVIYFGGNGVGAPGNNSPGEKIQFYGTTGTISSADCSIGIENNTLWFNSANTFAWYINASSIATMDTNGLHLAAKYLHFNGASNLVNNSGGPLLFADANNLVFQTAGTGANGWLFQNNAGTNVFAINASGTVTLGTWNGAALTSSALPSDVLYKDVTAGITVGYTVTSYNGGTVSSGTFTPSAANGNYQYITNGGAFTLAAPASDCGISLHVINNSSAGAITFSGYTVGSNTGDALDTTNGHQFRLRIERIDAISTYMIQALQ